MEKAEPLLGAEGQRSSAVAGVGFGEQLQHPANPRVQLQMPPCTVRHAWQPRCPPEVEMRDSCRSNRRQLLAARRPRLDRSPAPPPVGQVIVPFTGRSLNTPPVSRPQRARSGDLPTVVSAQAPSAE